MRGSITSIRRLRARMEEEWRRYRLPGRICSTRVRSVGPVPVESTGCTCGERQTGGPPPPLPARRASLPDGAAPVHPLTDEPGWVTATVTFDSRGKLGIANSSSPLHRERLRCLSPAVHKSPALVGCAPAVYYPGYTDRTPNLPLADPARRARLNHDCAPRSRRRELPAARESVNRGEQAAYHQILR